jgi:hypothetical protein
MKPGDMLLGPYHSSFDNHKPRRILLIRMSDNGIRCQVMLENGTTEWWPVSTLKFYWKSINESR